jgi:hypothetical protein
MKFNTAFEIRSVSQTRKDFICKMKGSIDFSDWIVCRGDKVKIGNYELFVDYMGFDVEVSTMVAVPSFLSLNLYFYEEKEKEYAEAISYFESIGLKKVRNTKKEKK